MYTPVSELCHQHESGSGYYTECFGITFSDYELPSDRMFPFVAFGIYVYAGDQPKRILRDLLYRKVSPDLFARKKQGFGIPVGMWFRGELKELLLDVVNETSLKDIGELNGEKVIRLRDRHIRKEENDRDMLWYVFTYVLWLRTFKSL